MKKCRYCGAMVEDNFQYCTNCGKEFSMSTTIMRSTLQQESNNENIISHMETSNNESLRNTGNGIDPVVIIASVVICILIGSAVFGGYRYWQNVQMKQQAIADSLERVKQDSVAFADSIKKLRQDSIHRSRKKKVIVEHDFPFAVVNNILSKYYTSRTRLVTLVKSLDLDIVHDKIEYKEYEDGSYFYYHSIVAGKDVKAVRTEWDGIDIVATTDKGYGLVYTGWGDKTELRHESMKIIFSDKREADRFIVSAKSAGFVETESYEECFLQLSHAKDSGIWYVFKIENGKYICKCEQEH